jgi:hypothetical protein
VSSDWRFVNAAIMSTLSSDAGMDATTPVTEAAAAAVGVAAAAASDISLVYPQGERARLEKCFAKMKMGAFLSVYSVPLTFAPQCLFLAIGTLNPKSVFDR